MFTEAQQRICIELVELYKAQLPLVEPRDAMATEWTQAERDLYYTRAERIAELQNQLSSSVREAMPLRVARAVSVGSWGDR